MACMRTAPLAAAAAFVARAPLRDRRGHGDGVVATVLRRNGVGGVTPRHFRVSLETCRRPILAAVSNANDAASTSSTDSAAEASTSDARDAHDAHDAHDDAHEAHGDALTSPKGDVDRVGTAKAGTGAVVWFRQDLRLDDNQAFRAAVRAANRRGGDVVCVFVWSEEEEGDDHASWAPGAASRVWLHHSLAALDRDLRVRYGGGGLQFHRGPHAPALIAASRAADATTIFATKRYEPSHRKGDADVAARLARDGVELVQLPGHLLFDPKKIQIDMRQERYFFGTLMPFLHAAEKSGGKPGVPQPAPPAARIVDVDAASTPAAAEWGADTLEALGLAPPTDAAADWSAGIRADWDMSEAGAAEAWEQFMRVNLAKYEDDHGRSDMFPAAVSRLSPYLRFGQLSPRRVYHELSTKKISVGGGGAVEGRKLSRLFWHRLYRREFAYWQLRNWPELSVRSVRTHYEGRGDWATISASHAHSSASASASSEESAASADREQDETAAAALRRWQTGTTGFPVVDAGMRRLWATGWMHQTERMIAATFLVDYCGVHWTHGARWFHDTLVDADLAINSMMWQNAGKSGLDQWDVFSGGLTPDGSARTHDPLGESIARWVPELAELPTGHLRHRPWQASPAVLAAAGVELGVTYPNRLLADPELARRRMVEGVTAVRAAEVRKAAEAAEASPVGTGVDAEGGGGGDGRVDVLIDVHTGADYIVVPPGATKDHEGVLLPLSTRKEFKKELRADAGIKAAMKAAAAWAASVLNVGVTAAAGCGASADESGKARAADIGKKRSDRAAKAGHSHSHSHSHGGLVHSHSHGGHSHGAGEAVPHGHIGHTHSGGGGGKSDKRSASAGRGKKATAPGKKNVNVVDHRSSGWAHSGSKRAVRGLSAKEAERKAVKAARRQTRELAAMSSGMSAGRADELVRRPGLRGRGQRTGDDEDEDVDQDYYD